jgi:hypothetical protein
VAACARRADLRRPRRVEGRRAGPQTAHGLRPASSASLASSSAMRACTRRRRSRVRKASRHLTEQNSCDGRRVWNVPRRQLGLRQVRSNGSVAGRGRRRVMTGTISQRGDPVTADPRPILLGDNQGMGPPLLAPPRKSLPTASLRPGSRPGSAGPGSVLGRDRPGTVPDQGPDL